MPLRFEALDERFQPYADQWAYLASVRPMDRVTVEDIAREAARLGHVVGVRSVELEDERRAKPWMRPPSGWSLTLPIDGHLPEVIHAVLAQRLFVEKAGLPSALINGVKRLAAFQNPEFYKKQSMRLSTALTPRVIGCAEDLPEHVALPRGCRPKLERLLDERGGKLDVEDNRGLGDPIDVEFRGEPTVLQELAAHAILANDDGVFVGPSTSPKSFAASRGTWSSSAAA